MVVNHQRIHALLAQAPLIDGVLQLNDELQQELVVIQDATLFPAPLEVPKINPKLSIMSREETGKCVIAMAVIQVGEVVLTNTSTKLSRPLRYSWQIDKDIHLLGPGVIDHNCDNPTCAIDPKTNNLVAFRQINPGEIATFNYLTTEYELISPFECNCGEKDCFGIIKGFKFLSHLQKRELRQRFPIAAYLQTFID
jgi:hypothetical protein